MIGDDMEFVVVGGGVGGVERWDDTVVDLSSLGEPSRDRFGKLRREVDQVQVHLPSLTISVNPQLK